MEQCAFSVNDNWKFHCHLKGQCFKINIKSFEYIQPVLRRRSCSIKDLLYKIHDDRIVIFRDISSVSWVQ